MVGWTDSCEEIKDASYLTACWNFQISEYDFKKSEDCNKFSHYIRKVSLKRCAIGRSNDTLKDELSIQRVHFNVNYSISSDQQREFVCVSFHSSRVKMTEALWRILGKKVFVNYAQFVMNSAASFIVILIGKIVLYSLTVKSKSAETFTVVGGGGL